MQPYAFPRWFGFTVGLASTIVGALQLVEIAPASGTAGKLLAVAAIVCTWLATLTHSVQGKGGKGTPLLPGGDPGGPSARALLPLLFLAPLLAACGVDERPAELVWGALVGLVALGGWYLWRVGSSGRRAPAVALALLAAWMALPGCATFANGVDGTRRTALAGDALVEGCQKAVIAWNKERTRAIVAETKKRAKVDPSPVGVAAAKAWGHTALDKHIALRSKLQTAIVAGKGLVLTGQALADAMEVSGQIDEPAIAAWRELLAVALNELLDALRAAGVSGAPPMPSALVAKAVS